MRQDRSPYRCHGNYFWLLAGIGVLLLLAGLGVMIGIGARALPVGVPGVSTRPVAPRPETPSHHPASRPAIEAAFALILERPPEASEWPRWQSTYEALLRVEAPIHSTASADKFLLRALFYSQEYQDRFLADSQATADKMFIACYGREPSPEEQAEQAQAVARDPYQALEAMMARPDFAQARRLPASSQASSWVSDLPM